MNRKPRRVNGGILNKNLWKRIVWDGILMGIASFILFLIGLQENDLNLGRTMVFSGLVFAQIFQALRFSLRRMKNILKEAFSNKYLSLAVIFSIAVQLLVLFTPLGVRFFNLKILSFNEFLLVLLISLIPIYEFIGERIYEKISKRTSNL